MKIRYIDVHNANLGAFGTPRYYISISLKSKVTDTQQNGKRVFTPVDDDEAACFQVGDNYGNCLYMTRTNGNILFKALKGGKIDRTLSGWDLHHAITAFLREQNIAYTVACSRP